MDITQNDLVIIFVYFKQKGEKSILNSVLPGNESFGKSNQIGTYMSSFKIIFVLSNGGEMKNTTNVGNYSESNDIKLGNFHR